MDAATPITLIILGQPDLRNLLQLKGFEALTSASVSATACSPSTWKNRQPTRTQDMRAFQNLTGMGW